MDSEIPGAKVGWKILAAYVDGSSLAPSQEQTQCVTGIGRYLNLARKSHNSATARSSTRLRTERENLHGDAKGKGTSGTNREAENTDAPVRGGLLRLVRKRGNARGAKGAGP